MKSNTMKSLNQLLGTVCIAIAFAGCASAPARFYTLSPAAKGDGASAVPCGVIVGPVFIPSSVDRPQFTIAAGPNRVEIDEFNRWAAPLGDSIARVVSADLGALLGTSRVTAAPMPDFGPAYRVSIRVEQFESVRGGAAQNGGVLVEAMWAVRGPTGQEVKSGRTTAREPAPDNSFDALAAAHSRALAKVSGDIATVIRSAASNKP